MKQLNSAADPRHDEPRTAGIVSRGLAAIIDLVVVLTIMGGLYLALVLSILVFSPTQFSLPSVSKVFSTLGTLGVAGLYLTSCWAVSGCTAGAVTMGIRVVGRRTSRVRPQVALLRAVAYLVFPIGLLWVAVDSRRRSLQDIVFRTRVVYARR